MTAPGPTPDRAFGARLAGLSIIVAAALARACVGFEPFPLWDGDPFILASPSTSVGPAASILLDVITVIGATTAMFGAARAGTRAHAGVWGAVLAGTTVVMIHARPGLDLVIDHLRVGSQWTAAFIGAAAAFEVCRDHRLRRLALASLAALVVMLALKGALQLLVEHPETVAHFKQTRDAFYASNGWTPDSSAARAFERRLLQPEASGWFGMANVFASWGAFGAVSLFGLGAIALSRRLAANAAPTWSVGALAAGAATGIASVAMAQSKGGWAAFALGYALLALAAAVALRSQRGKPSEFIWRLLRAAPLLCVLAALTAVILRGLAGDRIGELSLRFRWFYMIGAARTFAAHPVIGVGPDAFKDAYMLFKPPISPEEVTSPHSILFDYSATLGLGGLAWSGLWLWWVWLTGAPMSRSVRAAHPTPDGGRWTLQREARLLFVIISAATVFGAFTEAVAGTVEGTIARLFGLIGATVVAAAAVLILRMGPRSTLPLACSAAALAAHAQIELTPVWAGSAPAFLLVFGALAAHDAPPEAHAVGATVPIRAGRLAALTSMMLVAFAAGLLVLGWRPVHAWEIALAAAADDAAPASEAHALAAQLQSDVPAERAAAAGALSDHLTKHLGRPIGDSESALRRGLEDIFLACARPALQNLESAASRVTHPGTVRAASRLALQVGTTLRERSEFEEAAAFNERAEDLAGDAVREPLQRAASLGWLGTVRAVIADSTGDRSELELAVDAWQGAARADPYGLAWPVKLARALQTLGRTEDSASWARKALDLDDLSRLDPLHGLSARDKSDMARIAAAS